MDLLALYAVLRRHLVILGVVLLLVVAGNAYVIFGVPPQYESSASYVLVNPPAPPTEAEIARDPSLGKLNYNNPFLRLPVPSIVVDVLTTRVSSDAVRDELVAQGADPEYLIAPTNAIGAGLVVQITGTGRSAVASHRTVELVAARMAAELHDMQKVEGADDRFLIRALPVSAPTKPLRKVTATMRSLVAVTVAGVMALFAALSIAEAAAARRRRRDQTAGAATGPSPAPVPGTDVEPVADASTEPDAEPVADASTEPDAEPVADASTEPDAEPVADAATEPAAGSGAEPDPGKAERVSEPAPGAVPTQKRKNNSRPRSLSDEITSEIGGW